MKMHDTHATLLEAGLRALSVAGLSGVTLGRLATAAGLSKSGLFAHFRSKQQLEIELLDEAVRRARAHVVEPAMEVPEGLPGGCPVAAALFELDDLDGEVRDHMAALEREWRALLEALVARAVDLRHLRAGTDAAQVVWELCGIYLSHHASLRFHRDAAADERARVAVDALLARCGADGAAP